VLVWGEKERRRKKPVKEGEMKRKKERNKRPKVKK
jgi:hypothetical protein